jgi:hypothetical protein
VVMRASTLLTMPRHTKHDIHGFGGATESMNVARCARRERESIDDTNVHFIRFQPLGICDWAEPQSKRRITCQLTIVLLPRNSDAGAKQGNRGLVQHGGISRGVAEASS